MLIGFGAAEHYLHFGGHPSTIYLRAQTGQVQQVDGLLAAQADPQDPGYVSVFPSRPPR